MSNVYVAGDLHLGHNNIHKYRDHFSSAEEHHEIIFDTVASSVNKKDSLILTGDVCFTKEWLNRVASLSCHTTLVVGNHDLERSIKMQDLVLAYDKVFALGSRRNVWLSHAPLHPQEIGGKDFSIHGHVHGKTIMDDKDPSKPHPLYFNSSLENIGYKPIKFREIQEIMRERKK